MLPGHGSVVANASGTGVHDAVGYCGHGGGGGFTARWARCCWISLVIVGMKMGFAEAAPAHTSVAATATTALPAAIRRCLDKASPAVFVPLARRWPDGYLSEQRRRRLELSAAGYLEAHGGAVAAATRTQCRAALPDDHQGRQGLWVGG